MSELEGLKSDIENSKIEIAIGANSFIQELERGLGDDMLKTLSEKDTKKDKICWFRRFLIRLNNILN